MAKARSELGYKQHVPEQYVEDQVAPLQFANLGFSANFLVNIFVPAVNLLVAWGVHFAVGAYYRHYKRRHGKEHAAESSWRFAYELTYSFVIKSHENNFFLMTVAILLQFRRVSFYTVFNAVSFCACVLFTVYLFAFYARIYRVINHKTHESQKRRILEKYGAVVEDIQYDLHRQDKLTYKRRNYQVSRNATVVFCRKNYHLLGVLKKFVFSLIVVVYHDDPFAATLLSSVEFFLYFVFTLVIRPYYFLLSNVLKVLSDALILVILLLTFSIQVLSARLQSATSITSADLERLANLGNLESVLILALHALHLLMFFQFVWILKQKLRIRSELRRRREEHSVHNSEQSVFATPVRTSEPSLVSHKVPIFSFVTRRIQTVRKLSDLNRHHVVAVADHDTEEEVVRAEAKQREPDLARLLEPHKSEDESVQTVMLRKYAQLFDFYQTPFDASARTALCFGEQLIYRYEIVHQRRSKNHIIVVHRNLTSVALRSEWRHVAISATLLPVALAELPRGSAEPLYDEPLQLRYEDQYHSVYDATDSPVEYCKYLRLFEGHYETSRTAFYRKTVSLDMRENSSRVALIWLRTLSRTTIESCWRSGSKRQPEIVVPLCALGESFIYQPDLLRMKQELWSEDLRLDDDHQREEMALGDNEREERASGENELDQRAAGENEIVERAAGENEIVERAAGENEIDERAADDDD